MPKSVFTDAYTTVVDHLIALRKAKGVTQVELARRIGKPQQFISLIERKERRIDVVEFFVIVSAIGGDPVEAFRDLAAELPDNIGI
jgi:transcriptional regulator with XRE-family HTH domain